MPGDVLTYQNGGTGYVDRASILSALTPSMAGRFTLVAPRPAREIRTPIPIGSSALPSLASGSISSETYLCIGTFPIHEAEKPLLSYSALPSDALSHHSSQALAGHHAEDSATSFRPGLDARLERS